MIDIKGSPIFCHIAEIRCAANSFIVAREHKIFMIVGSVFDSEQNKDILHCWNLGNNGQIIDFTASKFNLRFSDYKQMNKKYIEDFPKDLLDLDIKSVFNNENNIVTFVNKTII